MGSIFIGRHGFLSFIRAKNTNPSPYESEERYKQVCEKEKNVRVQLGRWKGSGFESVPPQLPPLL